MLALQRSDQPAASCNEQVQCIVYFFWANIACLSTHRISVTSDREQFKLLQLHKACCV